MGPILQDVECRGGHITAGRTVVFRALSSSMAFGHPPPPGSTLVHPQTEPSYLDMIVKLRRTVVAAQFHPGQG
jgi:hypothetical protein